MKIVVYGPAADDPSYRHAVEAMAAPDLELSFMAASGASRTIASRPEDSIVYFDAEAFPAAKMAELARKGGRPWGVLDLKGTTADPAALIHAGAADYLGPLLRGTGPVLCAERARRVKDLAAARSAAACADAAAEADAPYAAAPFPGWTKLKAETCYPFVFVYAALGDQQGIRSRLGEKRLDKLRADFSSIVDNWAEELGGKLWIRDAAANLVLFPVAEERGRIIPGLVRLQLNKLLIGYEQLRMDSPIRFRFAVHVGEAPWRKPGSTGTVVSDHVNFIYHLGIKAMEDGMLGVAESAFPLIPAPLETLFVDAPDFEHRRIKRLRAFL